MPMYEQHSRKPDDSRPKEDPCSGLWPWINSYPYLRRFMMSSNRFAGKCECGSWVEANAGIYRGVVFCSEPIFLDDLLTLSCPNHVEAKRAIHLAQCERDRQRGGYEPSVENQIEDGICGKCGGDGKYQFWNGDKGECFACDGSGKISERNNKQRRSK